ncbi:hypothetical protein Xmir_03806 [Xenorhabdus miraniensis]|uniref:Uncharacterized protein n=1 Tax=Xenorhabdus miraniensis TaxID=351674 RepID=A0A2D0JKW2_9GAMM|nr:hypothetical protein Xmir_03806 [Xenorhabdus miraniensis]
MTGQGGLIKRCQLTNQNTSGPAIGNNMMLGKQQHMFLIGQLQQLTADQRALSQIERRTSFIFGKFRNTVCAGRFAQRTQVQIGKSKTNVCMINLLTRLSVNQCKVSTQALLTGDKIIECQSKRLLVQLTRKSQYYRDMVGLAGGRIELIEEPQPLLGKRNG